MTDLETFTQMLNRAGIVYDTTTGHDEYTQHHDEHNPQQLIGNDFTWITIREGGAELYDDAHSRSAAPHNDGYTGFYTTVSFTANGTLWSIGAWE